MTIIIIIMIIIIIIIMPLSSPLFNDSSYKPQKHTPKIVKELKFM